MPCIPFYLRHVFPAALCFAIATSSAGSRARLEPKWIRVSSAHFSVLTDAGEKKGREASLRLEQMRDIFSQLFLKSKLGMPEPLDVIALQSDEEYIRVAPLRQGQPISAPGFFLRGRRSQLHRSRSRGRGQLAAQSPMILRVCCLNFNYPPTQEWFDEGFAQYFSSLRLGDNQA